MTTEKVLIQDYREEEGKEIIQKVLRLIKPLSKYIDETEPIPIEAIEKVIGVITKKYSIQPQWITCFYDEVDADYDGSYSCGIKTADTHEWLGTVRALGIYELLAKVAILMYSLVKSGDVRLRTKTKEEEERERKARKVDKQREGD